MKRDRPRNRPAAGGPVSRRAGAEPSGAGRPRSARTRKPALVLASVVLLIALAALGWWGSRRFRSVKRDPAVARAMMEQGFALSRAWRLEEALESFRRARDSSPQDDWLVHYAIANTAGQLANHSIERAGLPVHATRSSVERVALVNEALREYDLSLRLAETPGDRANVLSQRGDLCFLWGLQWEADASYEAAAAAEPQAGARQRKLAEFRDMLEHPEFQLTTEEWMRMSPDAR